MMEKALMNLWSTRMFDSSSRDHRLTKRRTTDEYQLGAKEFSWSTNEKDSFIGLCKLEDTLLSLQRTNEAMETLLVANRAIEEGILGPVEVVQLRDLYIRQKVNIAGYRNVVSGLLKSASSSLHLRVVERVTSHLASIERSTSVVLSALGRPGKDETR